ncbi:DUF3419 family protein [Sulfobacillus acidophilus]|uniref:DUF3419 family protein n=1 Tax=Sulfobacillus acidophilus TaxID=53633 RepID=A0ABS3B0H9_9FIRM|nr:DUF3419 family protein [Sulfobacillus acidophilus]
MQLEKAKLQSEIAKKMSWDFIRYANVWEDSDVLNNALKVNSCDNILSISSAGCNVLSLLLKGPKSITAIDLNRSQNALLELKIAGIKNLNYNEFICLLGFKQKLDRLFLYEKLRKNLSKQVLEFWDNEIDTIEKGIVFCGRLEKYFLNFQKNILGKYFSKKELQDNLFTVESRKNEFLVALKNNDLFKKDFIWYFGKQMLAKQGRDPAQFAYVSDVDIGDYFWHRFCNILASDNVKDNFYLQFFLTSGYQDLNRTQHYLNEKNFLKLKHLVGKIVVVNDEIENLLEDAPRGFFTKANFSDIFEYMNDEIAQEFFENLSSKMPSSGRFVFWNFLVKRVPAKSNKIRHLKAESLKLFKQDRVFFYRDLLVCEVC